mgnify:FL=1
MEPAQVIDAPAHLQTRSLRGAPHPRAPLSGIAQLAFHMPDREVFQNEIECLPAILFQIALQTDSVCFLATQSALIPQIGNMVCTSQLPTRQN